MSGAHQITYIIIKIFYLFSINLFTRYGKSHIGNNKSRGSIRSTRGLGPTMTARGQSISISIGMLPQTLIVSRLDQLSQLDARI
jgi:hypothetical protein